MYKIINDPVELGPKIWSEFVKKHPKGNIFQTPEMYEVYSNTNNYEPIILTVLDNQTEELLGLLLAVIQKEHKGFLGNFTARSIIIGAPIVKDDNKEVLDYLLSAYNKVVEKKAIYTQIRDSNCSKNSKDLLDSNFHVREQRLNILNDISKDKEEIINAIHKGKRGNFSKARNKGVEFLEITEIDFINKAIELIFQTYKRIKLPLADKSLFMNAFKILYPVQMLRVFVANYNSKIIGVRFILAYKETLYDWYAGANDNFKNYYPNDFLIYNILLWGAENGFKVFNFGGAGKPGIPYGVRDHKMKFGGKLIETQRFTKIHKPLLMKTGEFGLKVYKKIN